MSTVPERLEGVVWLTDDILVYGKDQEDHDTRLKAVLRYLEERNLTFNLVRCSFSQTRVKFLGHINDDTGIHPDPEKHL